MAEEIRVAKSEISGLRRREIIGTAMAIGGASLWATNAVWLRRLMTVYPLTPVQAMFWRDFFVSLLLLIIVLATHSWRFRKKDLPILLAFGLVGVAMNNSSWGYSVKMNGVTVATVLAYTAPAFTVLLAWPLFGEKITKRKLVSLVMALFGCLLVSQVYAVQLGGLRTFGLAMAFAVGLTQAGRDLIGKKVSGLYPALTGTFFGFFFGTIFIGIGQASQGLLANMPAIGWLEMLGMAAGTMAAYTFYVGALGRLPVSIVCILGVAEPVVAAVMSYLVYNEVLSLPQFIGCLMVVFGVAFLETRNGR